MFNPVHAKSLLFFPKVLVEEKLADNAAVMGQLLRDKLSQLPASVVKLVRGQGLLNAIQIQPQFSAWDVCLSMRDKEKMRFNE